MAKSKKVSKSKLVPGFDKDSCNRVSVYACAVSAIGGGYTGWVQTRRTSDKYHSEYTTLKTRGIATKMAFKTYEEATTMALLLWHAENPGGYGNYPETWNDIRIVI